MSITGLATGIAHSLRVTVYTWLMRAIISRTVPLERVLASPIPQGGDIGRCDALQRLLG
jgi:hypothetical protein